MTLLQMEYFSAVVRSGSITNAAEELYVSRPAVSRAIRDLEQELGIALLRRSNTGLSLTDAGCAFYEACSDIQKRIDSVQAKLSLMRESNRTSSIRLGLTPLTGTAIFPLFWNDFHAACPDVEIIVMEHSHEQARLMLEDGSMDASFTTHTEGLSENVGNMIIAQTQLLLCVAPEHPFAKYKKISIREIKDTPLVYLAKGMQREKEIQRRFRQEGCEPRIVLRLSQMNALRDIIVKNHNVAAIQLHGSIDDNIHVVGIPFDPPIQFQISLIWNRSIEDRSAGQKLLSFAKKWNALI